MSAAIQGQIIKGYIERFPKTANRTLAKKIYDENKGMWNTVESVRSTLRIHKGASGDASRRRLGIDKPLTAVPTLPESFIDNPAPLKLSKANNNILLISDLHIPYHDIAAVEIAVQYGIEQGCNTVIINGDLMDFHGLSKFEKDPRKRSVKQEFDATEQFLRYLRAMFPSARIIWMEGNHDARYPKWLMNHAQHFFDDEYYSLQERLNLRTHGVEFVSEKVLVYAGKLALSHGHKIVMGIFSPVNSGRGAFTKAIEPVIIGHTHKPSEHSERTLSGKLITCWSTGCLCDLNPDYNPFVNKYAHGFAHITTRDNGHYTVHNKRIHNGELM